MAKLEHFCFNTVEQIGIIYQTIVDKEYDKVVREANDLLSKSEELCLAAMQEAAAHLAQVTQNKEVVFKEQEAAFCALCMEVSATNQSDAGSAGIFSRRTNQTQMRAEAPPSERRFAKAFANASRTFPNLCRFRRRLAKDETLKSEGAPATQHPVRAPAPCDCGLCFSLDARMGRRVLDNWPDD
eukprot:6015695-Pyramimonas_sp.AAC.2